MKRTDSHDCARKTFRVTHWPIYAAAAVAVMGMGAFAKTATAHV
jgi:hypothetical protein